MACLICISTVSTSVFMKIPDAALFLKNFHQLSLFQVLEVPKSLLSYISFGTKQFIKHLSFIKTIFSLFINVIESLEFALMSID